MGQMFIDFLFHDSQIPGQINGGHCIIAQAVNDFFPNCFHFSLMGLYLNFAPAIYRGLKPLMFKACFAILILTI